MRDCLDQVVPWTSLGGIVQITRRKPCLLRVTPFPKPGILTTQEWRSKANTTPQASILSLLLTMDVTSELEFLSPWFAKKQ